MPHMTNWAEWTKVTVPAGLTPRAIARAISGDNKSVGRWLAMDEPPAEFVIRLARAFQADPVVALVAAGHLRSDEVKAVGLLDALRSATDVQLAEEIFARASRGEAGPELTGDDLLKRSQASGSLSRGGGGGRGVVPDLPTRPPLAGGGGGHQEPRDIATTDGSPSVVTGHDHYRSDSHLLLLDDSLTEAEQLQLLTFDLRLASRERTHGWDGRERRRKPPQTGPRAEYKSTSTRR